MSVVLLPYPFPRIGEKERLRPAYLPVSVTVIGSLQKGDVSDGKPFLQAHLMSSEITLMN